MLIIGRIPPPIGGVSVHVHRLVYFLEKKGFKFKHLSLEASAVVVLKNILKHKNIHLNASNPFIRLVFAIVCYLLKKKLIITYHGNLNRFGFWKNLVDFASLKICTVPIVLNDESLELAKPKNNNVRLLTAYITPSVSDRELPAGIVAEIKKFTGQYHPCFATCAYSRSYDTDGQELYGVEYLVEMFTKYQQCGLIVSDPSGEYGQYFRLHGGVSENVMFISEPHSFVAVMENVDAYLRATTTDGDSLSIREALDIGITVIASDCVSRPEGVILFDAKNRHSLLPVVSKCLTDNTFENARRLPQENGAAQLLALYGEFDSR